MTTYSIGNFAKIIGVSEDTLCRWNRADKLNSHRTIGNHRYYTDEDVNSYFGTLQTKDKTTTQKNLFICKSIKSDTIRRFKISS